MYRKARCPECGGVCARTEPDSAGSEPHSRKGLTGFQKAQRISLRGWAVG